MHFPESISHMRKRSAWPQQAGFTIVELMVATVIALLCTLVVMQVFSISEGQKRTTTGGSDAQTNGAIGLYQIEREARLAGYGLVSLELLGCPFVRLYNEGTGNTTQVSFLPFQINPPTALVAAGDANTDTVAIVYGSSDGLIEGTGAYQVANAAANFKVANRAGFKPGDLVIGYQDIPGTGIQCTIHEVTGVPGGSCGDPPGGGSDNIIHNSGNYKNVYENCQNKSATRNRPGGIPGVQALDSANGARLFNIGPLPINQAYAIRNGNLTVCDLMNLDCSVAANFTPIINDIVSMRAVYGRDANGNGSVESGEWTRTAPASAAEWRQLLAVRLALVSRNPLREKANTAGTCDITTDKAKPDKMEWMNQSTAGAAIDLSTSSADWQCFRYKLFQTVVPLRNIIWQPL